MERTDFLKYGGLQGSHTVPSSKLARAIGISPRYLLQIGAKLRDEGLVAVTHGVAGGYKISKHPAEIICLIEHKPCIPVLHRFKAKDSLMRLTLHIVI